MNSSVKAIHNLRKVAVVVSVAVYAVLWLGGVGQHLFGNPAEKEFDWTASLYLFLAGVIVLLGSKAAADVASLLAVAAFGFVIEVIGVRSGLPFGSYNYTAVLQPQLFGVPIVMGFAWMVLVAAIHQTLHGSGLGRWLAVLLASLWMTAIDLLIDPLAANQLGYWHWRAAGVYYGIPAVNFAGWFVSSLLVFGFLKLRGTNLISSFLGLSIVMFFSLIALAHQMFVVALIGFALSGMQILVWRKVPKRD